MFPFAVEAGIDASQYWYYTIPELNATVEGYRKRLATQAAMDYKLADLIGSSVSRLMSKNGKFPTLEEAYPGLIEPRRPTQQQQNWRVAKERLLQYANAHNAKRRGDK